MINAADARLLSSKRSFGEIKQSEFNANIDHAAKEIKTCAEAGYNQCVLEGIPWMYWDSEDVNDWSKSEPIGDMKDLFIALTEKQFSCAPACKMHRNGLYMPYGTRVSW